MKTICVDGRMYSSSGIGTYIRNILLQWKEPSHFSLQILTSKEVLDAHPELSSFAPILVSAPIYSVKESWELAIKTPPCDLFWSPHFNVPMLPIRAKKRVVTIHDVFHLAHLSQLSFLEKGYAKTVISYAAKKSDLIITDSFFSKEEIVKYTRASKDKIEMIHLGVDTDRFTSYVEDRDRDQKVEQKYHLPSRYLLFVGNIKPHKNIENLLKAVRILKQKGHLFPVVIVGKLFPKDGVWDRLQRESLLGDHIKLLQEVSNEELPSLYRLATLTVQPSFYEGFGLPPLEAMSSGCPVIASHAASLPEVCGDASMYFDPHSPEEMAAKIESVMDNTGSCKEALIQKGYERIKNFCWKKTASRHLDIFKRLLFDENSTCL